ncbi:MAG TPA: divergent polysaccharide deacetylase family protein [Candidatus Xenobia bacterium]
MPEKKASKKPARKKPSAGVPGGMVAVLVLGVGIGCFALGYRMAPAKVSHPAVKQHMAAHRHEQKLVRVIDDSPSPAATSTQPVLPPSPSPSATAVPPKPTATPTPTPSPVQTPTPVHTATPAAPVPSPSPKLVGKVAVIIDDFGNNYDEAEGFIHAPLPLTLSVLPKLAYTERIADEGSRNGKTIMLHLPMEPVSDRNPGPGTIKTSMSDTEITDLFRSDLASVPHVDGVNNHEGSKATQDVHTMRRVMEEIHDRHLFYVDSMTTGSSVAGAQAQAVGVPFTIRNVFLDNEDDDDKIKEQIKLLADDAKQHGTAVGIGHVRIRTLRCLLDMAPALKADGIELVSIKELVGTHP